MTSGFRRSGTNFGLGMSLIVCLIVASSAKAQREARVPDPDPEIERKSFQMADGFEVNLFAADPMLAKPIQISFDSQGRLWVASSEVYPQLQPGKTANDKILILEDADGDGRSDKTTVFADGLLIPTGIEPGDGGAYVANSTEILFLKDTDGDGKADQRRVVLSGFGTEDTHHIIHTFRWGHDGLFYFNQSVYIHSHVETPHGPRRLGGGGVWQFRPESMHLEVFTRGLINPWGHHVDRWGQQFATDGAGYEGINHLVPGATFTGLSNPEKFLRGLNLGSPKYSGLEVLSGRHLPDDWQGNLLTNDFRANRVCRFVLSDDGSTFAAREMPELIKTSHGAFRPIDVKMGPDGAIYIADWYNPIIQHGEVDFRDPRRDHTHGRIWRVTAKNRPLVPRPKLVGATTEQLLDALKAPEDWTRHFAKLELKQRGTSIVPALKTWLQALDSKDADFQHQRLEALWLYQSLDVPEPDLLTTLLNDHDARVRAAAVRVVPHWKDRLSDPLALLSPRVVDENPRVRLEAVRALASIPDSRAALLALKALDQPVDKVLDYALWLTMRELQPHWLPALQAGRLDLGDGRRLSYALEAINTSEVVGPLLDALRAGRLPKTQESAALTFAARLGGSKELASILDLALADSTQPALRSTLLEASMFATQQRKVRPEGTLDRLGPWLTSKEESTRAAVARAVGVWKVESLRDDLAKLAQDGAAAESSRLAAIDGLALLGGKASSDLLDRMAKSESSARLRQASVVSLTTLDVQAAAHRAVAVLENPTPGQDVSTLVLSFLQRQGGAAALASTLKDSRLPPDVAKLSLRALRSSGRAEDKLVAVLTKAGGLDSSSQPLSPTEMEAFLADVSRLGDPARGEAIYRRPDLNCMNCHAIAGAGGRVGPGLESIGASAPLDYLVDSILQPNKAVKEGYHSVVIATNDGRVVSGIKLRQTETEIAVRDAEDREIIIPASNIEETKPGESLMPAGLTEILTRQELLDLVRFLSELGKVGPYSVGKERVARRWEIMTPAPETFRRLSRQGTDAAIATVSNDYEGPVPVWRPAYSNVAGRLPFHDIPQLKLQGNPITRGFARCQIEVTTPGRVELKLDQTGVIAAWIDDQRLEPRDLIPLDLSPGVHTLTLALDLERRTDDLRVELIDVSNSPAQARMVLGK